jgi:ABC-type siderophore export system fused ATPase/permease subunit
MLNSVPGIMRMKVAWNRVRQFLKDIPANVHLSKSPIRRMPFVECLEMEEVFFQHKSNGDGETFSVGPVNLEIRQGEVLFIIGGNGSGKTTLAKLLTGLYTPDSGRILMNGKPVTGSQLSEQISAVFSPFYLFEKLYNINTTGREDEIKKCLKLLDLEKKVEIKDNEYSTINLSGGQRKRLALLQCYLEDCPIYLFDEWAADQDPEYRHFFYRVLLPEMKAAGKSIIAITHDDHYFDVADKILKMNEGKSEIYTPATKYL